jgi:hypothetical protein
MRLVSDVANESDSKTLLEFLKMTKEGQYAMVRQSDLKFVRIKEITHTNDLMEEEFYYGIR